MNLRTAASLHDAWIAASRIQKYLANRSFEDYVSDDYFRSAVERQFEILSGALDSVARRDPESSNRFPEQSELVGIRERISQNDDRSNLQIVWNVATGSVPLLLPRIEEALAAFPLPEVFPLEAEER